MRLLLSVSLGLMAGMAAAAGEPAPGHGIPGLPADAAGRMAPDPRVRVYVAPKRVLWRSTGDKAAVENEGALLQAGRGQVMLSNPGACRLVNKGEPAGVLIDFGVELQGAVQIMVGGTPRGKATRLRIRLGESAAEAMSDVGGPKNATNDHAIRDDTILVPWLGTREFGNSGFRFARIDALDEGAVELVGVRAILLYRDLEYKGSFRCSDERLNRIWATGAYTVQLNMQDYVWDGIKRDRLVWIGDMHPETMTIATVFGDQPVVRASLDLVRDATPLPQWMNGISSYSLWWILIHHDWYRFHGDLAYLRAQKSYLFPLLDRLTTYVGDDGRERLDGMRFLDWPSAGNDAAVHAGLQALLTMALDAGAEMAQALGDAGQAAKCRAAAARLRMHVPDAAGSKQAAALMALAGLADAGKMNRDVLAVDGAQRMSTFYGYYMLEARARAGDVQGALDAIRQFWGGMLDLGATTFWEDFNLDWTKDAARIDELVPEGKKDIHGDFGAHCYVGFRHSLCHGWASGPTAWLSRHVLGIEVIEPGCKTVRVVPQLGDLQWAEGTFPTPLGIIRVRHEKRPDGTVWSQIDAPAGVKVLRQ